MINAKTIYTNLLNDSRLLELVDDDNICDVYPDEVESFPTVVFQDSNQTDSEFADNKPMSNNCRVTIHVFSKSLEGYPTTSEIGIVIADIFKENFFTCEGNGENDESDNVKHRVMNFRKEILS